MLIVATVLIIVILTLLILFQLALICGAPLGQFAWGGQHKILPTKLRISSVSSIVIYIIFILFATSKAQLWVVISHAAILNISLWVTTIYLALGVFLNALSRSKPERYLMTPVAAVLAGCFFILALS